MPLPTFVYGKSLLIGDAGHPMTPFTAQGANQALEDAGALLGLFSNITSKDLLVQRLAMYDKVRLVRATRIQTGASPPYKNGDPNPLAKAHKELLEMDDYVPADLKAKPTFDPDKQKWDFRYVPRNYFTSKFILLIDVRYNVFEKCEEVLREGAAGLD
jgi:2-polyprenyl-6-methoxyphenol hydroxylase-like FAD-dependent oxidoreductase